MRNRERSSHRLELLSPPAVREYVARDDRVILPVGSTENNGPHLPLATDTLAAEAVAEGAARRIGVLVAPPVPWGNSSVNLAFPGTIALDPELLAHIVESICVSLAEHGFRRFAIVSGHYGNVWPIASIAEVLRDRGLLVAQLDLWRAVEKLCKDLVSEEAVMPFGHGSELMTAVALAIVADAVERDRMVIEVPDETYGLKYYRSYPEVMGFAAWDEISRSGAVGDPTRATAEVGREALTRIASLLVELLDDMRDAALPSARTAR
jgi:creatinine amidohydrolase